FAVAVKLRRSTDELGAEERAQILTRLLRGTLRDARRVRAHVRDETDRALGADLDALVEILRDAHRALRSERELLRGFLLERGRRERRRRILAPLAALHLGDVERPARLQVVEDALRF